MLVHDDSPIFVGSVSCGIRLRNALFMYEFASLFSKKRLLVTTAGGVGHRSVESAWRARKIG
jgi:hypothetical protein